MSLWFRQTHWWTSLKLFEQINLTSSYVIVLLVVQITYMYLDMFNVLAETHTCTHSQIYIDIVYYILAINIEERILEVIYEPLQMNTRWHKAMSLLSRVITLRWRICNVTWTWRGRCIYVNITCISITLVDPCDRL